jgi:hypothetical protein
VVEESASADSDIALIKATGLAKAGAACMAGAGVLGLVMALQGVAVLRLRGGYRLSEPVFLVLGLLGIYAATKLAGMRRQGALLATVIGCLLALVSLVWFVITITHGVFLILPLALTPIAATAGALGIANLGDTSRADSARTRLKAQGLDAGF